MRILSLLISQDGEVSPSFPILRRLFQKIERTPTILYIDTFTLHLSWNNQRSCNVLEALEEIKQLDALFTRERFPRLRTLNLCISRKRPSYQGELPRQELANLYRQCLPNLAAMEGVELHCEVNLAVR